MYCEYNLVELINVEKKGDIKKPAIMYLAKMDYFNFDIDSQRNIKRFLCENHMEDGYYLVVGLDDSDFDVLYAVCYFRKRKHNSILSM